MTSGKTSAMLFLIIFISWELPWNPWTKTQRCTPYSLYSSGPFFVFVICSFTLSATAEKKFTLLFDGTNLDGWKQSGNWQIQKDQSVHRVGPGGSLTYTKSKIPDDFELRFEWKVGELMLSGDTLSLSHSRSLDRRVFFLTPLQ